MLQWGRNGAEPCSFGDLCIMMGSGYEVSMKRLVNKMASASHSLIKLIRYPPVTPAFTCSMCTLAQMAPGSFSFQLPEKRPLRLKPF